MSLGFPQMVQKPRAASLAEHYPFVLHPPEESIYYQIAFIGLCPHHLFILASKRKIGLSNEAGY